MDSFSDKRGGPTLWKATLAGVRLAVGDGALATIGDWLREAGNPRVLLVTDKGLVAAGHAESVKQAIGSAAAAVSVFDEVEENPSEDSIERGRAAAQAGRSEWILGLGGGSALDTAKGVALLVPNGGKMRDYRGYGLAKAPALPAIGIVTTAGTGSDAQSYALVSHDETHAKMACGDISLRFSGAILDPALARSAPAETVRLAGIDALSHAVESFVSRTSNPLSRMFAREGWNRLKQSFAPVVGAPLTASSEGWSQMLWGAHLAGAAIEQSMLGAAHACANPLTAHFGITHGRAVGLMLPHVVRFNSSAGEDPYLGLDAGGTDTILETLKQCASLGELPTGLGMCGVKRGDLPDLAQEAARQWTASHNPRPVGSEECLGLYEAAY